MEEGLNFIFSEMPRATKYFEFAFRFYSRFIRLYIERYKELLRTSALRIYSEVYIRGPLLAIEDVWTVQENKRRRPKQIIKGTNKRGLDRIKPIIFWYPYSNDLKTIISDLFLRFIICRNCIIAIERYTVYMFDVYCEYKISWLKYSQLPSMWSLALIFNNNILKVLWYCLSLMRKKGRHFWFHIFIHHLVKKSMCYLSELCVLDVSNISKVVSRTID
jgi:hypothetical protein